MYALYHKNEPRAVLTAVVIMLVSLGTLVFVAFTHLHPLQSEISASSFSIADFADWSVYRDDTYGFQVSYPPGWTLDASGLGNVDPFIAIGNPLSGKKTYELTITIQNNTSSLSSGEYVHALLDADKANDVASGASAGHAPSVTPQYEKTKVLSVGGAALHASDAGVAQSYLAYELYGVYEFDHLGEQIYVAHGAETLRFDFPVAQENPNISLPVANNSIAHEIVDSLVYTK